MNEKDKELLTEDLCSRLAYLGTKVQWGEEVYDMLGICFGRVTLVKPFMSYTSGSPLIEEVKPILRSLDSMTEEERETWGDIFINRMADIEKIDENDPDIENKVSVIMSDSHAKSIKWLNKHFFDYNGLIEKGLAIKADYELYENLIKMYEQSS